MRRSYSRSSIPTIFVNKQNEAPSRADRHLKIGPLALPLRLRYFIILPLIYLLGGIFLPSLWRGVDANTYSVLLGMGGETYFQGEVFKQSVATSPAYYRLLDFGTRIFSGIFSPPNSMRLTHALILLSSIVALYRALRSVFTPEIATVAVLVMSTCLGGLEFMHVVGQKAGVFLAVCVSLWGISQSFSRSYGGVVMGMGFVLSIMMGSGTIIPTLIPALILLVSKRGRNHPVFGVAMLLALSMMSVTLISLYMFTGRSATEWGLWIPLTDWDDWGDVMNSLIRQIWFTFPLWPTLLAFRHYTRKHWSANSQSMLLLGVMGLALALPLSLASSDGSMLLLPFLALLFAPSLLLIGSHWLRAWHWFNFLFFTIALLPLVLLRMVWSVGSHTKINDLLALQAPQFDTTLSLGTLIATTLIVLIWGYWSLAIKWHWSWVVRATLGWMIGVMALWGIVVLLWLPAIDYTKSYRGMIVDIQDLIEKKSLERKIDNACIDISHAPFAFQVNWRYFTNERMVDKTHCAFRLITLGKAERQSLLLSDESVRKHEDQIEENILESKTLENDSPTPNKNQPEWNNLEVFQRPGETRESVVLQRRSYSH